MPPPAETSVVEYDLQIDAKPETVFEYFTDPARMVAWMGSSATLDPRPGGVCRLTINRDARMVGEFVEVAPPSRVVFSWGWENRLLGVEPGSTLVEVSMTPNAGGTRLRLVHRKLPEATHEFHTIGWRHYLERLAIAAAGSDPGSDPMAARTLSSESTDPDR